MLSAPPPGAAAGAAAAKFREARFFITSSAPGSEAARDKWLLPKKVEVLEKVLPQAAKLPGTSGFCKKADFLVARDKWLLQKKTISIKNLPQAAKLPGTSGFFKKKSKF